MGQSFFVWKGIDCRAMGVRLRGPAPIIRPEERVNHITIPGRSGDLTQLEGENIYNSYIQTVTIMVHGSNRMGKTIFNWLRGEDWVTFSGEPDKKQKARIIGAVTLDRHSYNMDWWEGELQFYCQPLKELLQTETVAITQAGAVTNRGDVTSRPVIRAELTGSNVTVTIGGKSFSVTGVSGDVIEIDSDAEEVLNYNGSTLYTNKSTGAFPVLAPGDNMVQGSGWSKLTFDRRERYL